MRFNRCIFFLVLCLVLATGTPRLSGAQRESEFMKAFRQAMEQNASDEMARLVKEHEQEAVLAVMETCELIGKESSDRLEAEIDALGKAWRAAYDTRFVPRQYEYFSFLEGEFESTRDKLMEHYRLQSDAFAGAQTKKDKNVLAAVGVDFQALARGFEEVGDLYTASVCCLRYAACFDEPLLGEDADFQRVVEGLERAVALRKAIELEDALAREAQTRLEFLVSQGLAEEGSAEVGEAEEEAGAASGAAEPSPAGTAAPLGGTFELVADLEAVRRPSFSADLIYPDWTFVFLKEIGSQGKVSAMESSPAFIREGASKVKVDVDGDGKGDVEVPVTGKIAPVEITLGQGDAKRPWAFLATVGQQEDTFQGIRPFNLAPTPEQMTVYIAPAASIVGSVAGTRIQVFDGNMDGKYGGPPLVWAYPGLRENESQPEVDSILIGEAKQAVPWSELVKIGADWYAFQPGTDGSDITVQKTEVKTGTLRLDCKGFEPDFLIVRGRDKVANVYIDLAPGGAKGTPVPAGTYELFYGRFSKGKGAQIAKALILPSKATPLYRVDPGKIAAVELGEPFRLDFALTQDEQSVTVQGKTILVIGRGRETYQRLWNCVPRPEVHMRKAGTSKGSEADTMRPAQTMEESNEKGRDSLWYPIDVTLTKKEGEAVEVQLVEKKNKLFGKIESDWKG